MVFANHLNSGPLWRSELLRDGAAAQCVDIADLDSPHPLILVVDEAHDDAPADADPLGIQDEVNRLLPIVPLDSNVQFATESPLSQAAF